MLSIIQPTRQHRQGLRSGRGLNLLFRLLPRDGLAIGKRIKRGWLEGVGTKHGTNVGTMLGAVIYGLRQARSRCLWRRLVLSIAVASSPVSSS